MKILWKQLRSRIARKIYPEMWQERGDLRYELAALKGIEERILGVLIKGSGIIITKQGSFFVETKLHGKHVKMD